MERRKLLRIAILKRIESVRITIDVRRHLIHQKQIVQLPDFHIPFEKECWWSVIGVDQRSVPVAEKEPVMPKLYIDVACCIEVDVTTRLQKIDSLALLNLFQTLQSNPKII